MSLVAPSNLTAVKGRTGSSRVYLSWQDNSPDETGFEIERSTSPESGFTQIANVPGPTHVDAGLTPSTLFYYRVRAVNDGGASDYSNVASTYSPAAPDQVFP